MIRTIVIVVAAVCLLGCGTTRHTNILTAAPEPLVKEQIASSEGKQDAAMEQYDSSGYIVRASWVERYHRMLTAYWTKLPVRNQVEPEKYMDGIEKRGDKFHVTFEVAARYHRLVDLDSNPSHRQ